MATYKQSWDRLWSMPLPYGRLLHSRPALTNCKSCRMQHWELPQDAHKTQTSAWRNTHTFHTRAPITPRLTIQTEITTSITSTTQQTSHTVTTSDIKTNIHTSIVSRHLATRGNNKILRTPPPHIISSEEILPRLTRHTLAQLRTNKPPFLKS